MSTLIFSPFFYWIVCGFFYFGLSEPFMLLLLSHFSCVRLCATPSTAAHQAPPSPGKNTEVGCHFLLQCMKVKCQSEVAHSCPTPSDPWTAAYQAPPSMGFSRQEYWSGVPLPSPVICIPEVIDISPGNLDSSLCFIQPSISHDILRYIS